VIELLRSNTPTFFAPAEEKDLIAYLDKEIEDYFVVEENSKIIAAAGINYFPKEKRLTFLGILLNLNHKEKNWKN
jgi:N-acetylglutamate synthase-like GNAT family acetyltransferase